MWVLSCVNLCPLETGFNGDVKTGGSEQGPGKVRMVCSPYLCPVVASVSCEICSRSPGVCVSRTVASVILHVCRSVT